MVRRLPDGRFSLTESGHLAIHDRMVRRHGDELAQDGGGLPSTIEGDFVIGGGLAGSERRPCARRAGVPVTLVEQRPNAVAPPITPRTFAEPVCSNSLSSP